MEWGGGEEGGRKTREYATAIVQVSLDDVDQCGDLGGGRHG